MLEKGVLQAGVLHAPYVVVFEKQSRQPCYYCYMWFVFLCWPTCS